MFVLKTLVVCAAWLAVQGQGHNSPTTTPVPILKQINKQNDDGSYSYGYEAADGSFKIETKYPNGDVAGKYGYVDESGKQREISYGASSQRGFEPQGAGIVVPPPTFHEPSNALTDGQEDDGQYREDPKIYEDPKYNGRQASKQPAQQFKQFHQPSRPSAPEPQYQQYQTSFQSSFQPAETQTQRYQSQSYQQYQPQPVQQYQPQPVQQYQPQPVQQYQPQPIQQYQPQPVQQYQPQPVQQFQPQPSPSRSQFTQPASLFSQAPQQFPREQRPQSQVYHQQPQFSYQAYTPQPYSQYQGQNDQGQDYNPFGGHPAQNFDPNTGSYTINYTG